MELKIKYISKEIKHLKRFYSNDAGYDIFAPFEISLEPFETKVIPLGFKINLPSGTMGLIMPKSSLASTGLNCLLAPIDSSYNGIVHCILTNTTKYEYIISKDKSFCQLVIVQIIIPQFYSKLKLRKNKNFGSTNRR